MEQISPLSIGIGIGLFTILLLKCVLFHGDPSSCLKCLVHVILGFVFIEKAKSFSPKASPSSGCGCKNSAVAVPDPPVAPDNNNTGTEKLSGQEVEMVMRRLGISSKSPDGVGAVVGAKEIEVVFEDQEPSLGEVKDAFDVFDKNRDGFIDPVELRDVLCALGLRELSEVDCKKLIRAFDVNKDGLIDFREFTKLVEKSFCFYN